ncbi:hypothetical protein C823_007862 [Eubacterium plexicaudatum ASF492]|uniref:Uncharacterized protein n=1 Tax=Eubacterium plexicaudatum ASF492 TaxID=1235802 RepID=N1ZVY8_9FIRM|nr:hypothetical protein C823_007862 [Eubacterium plexicaudatum ASF492]
MTYMDVLEKWAIYSRYDREQTSFNLLSNAYGFHQIGKLIEMLLSEYDETGMLAVIYTKIQFENLLKETKITVWDVLSNPDAYRAEKDMYELFNTPIVTEAENDFIGRLNHIYLKITNGKLIGKDDGQIKQLFNSIEKVIESINRCNVDLFMKGGKINNVQNVSTKLYIFNTLAECLINIENAQDGIYFCFISASNSADCFFAFFLKSNGNIISVNDRVDEAYIGQHKNSRNGSWTEQKVDGIFPYDYIFNYSKRDYKGYASKYEINDEKLDLYNLGIEVFMPIVISMLLIVLKYTNKDVELPLHYLDSFLPENQLKIKNHKLMVIGKSNLIVSHNNVDISFDNQKILSGDYAEEFNFHNKKNINYKETGYFTNDNQLMVDLWGEGFVFDPTTIFKSNNISCLMDKENESYIPEFIGTEKRMRLQVYKEARMQLAEYIKEKIYQAWVDYGKTEKIKEWYQQSLLSNKEFIYRMLMKYEEEIENGIKSELSCGWRRSDGSINIYITRNDDYPFGHMLSSDGIIGCTRKRDGWKWLCNVTGCVCNMWFVIAPQTWEQLELLTNQEVPKIVKGWNVDGRSYYGNPLLDSTDAVASVGTPFEHNNSYSSDDKLKDAYYDFKVAFGFSKRGWNKIMKELKEQ